MKVWRVWGGAIDRGEEDRKWWMDEQQTRVELFEERRAGTEGRRVTNRGMVGQRGGGSRKKEQLVMGARKLIVGMTDNGTGKFWQSVGRLMLQEAKRGREQRRKGERKKEVGRG